MLKLKKKIMALLLAFGFVFQMLPLSYAFAEDDGILLDESFDDYTDSDQIKNFSFPDSIDLADDGKGGKAIKLKLTSAQNNTKFYYYLDKPITSGCYRLSYRVNPGEGITTHVTIDDTGMANHFTTMFMEWSGIFSSGYCWVDPALTLGTFPKNKWYTITATIDLDNGTVYVMMKDDEENVYVAPNKNLQIGSTRIKDISQLRFQIWSNADSESLFDDIKFERVPYSVKIDNLGPGNIASNVRECNATLQAGNCTNEKAIVNVKYDIYDENNVFVETRNVKAEIEPQKTTSIKIDLDVGKYGIFNAKIHTEIENEAGTKKEIYDTDYNYSKVMGQKDGYNSNLISACYHFQGGDKDAAIELADVAGIGKLRFVLYWWDCEKEKGKYEFDDYQLSAIDKIHDAGMDVLIPLLGHNSLYMDDIQDVNMPDTDESVEAFANWCANVAKTLKGKANNFEIWNEPNVTGFNRKNRGGEYYSKLLRASYKAIKKENPDATVVAFGGANYDYIKGSLEADPDLLEFCDAVSIHPYDRNFKNEPEFPDKWLNQFTELKELMAQYGEVKPIWDTEMGWSTYDDSNYDNPWHDPSTELQQAQKLVQAATVLQAYDASEEMYIYSFMDEGLNNEDAEHRWGLVTNYQQTSDGGYHAKKSYVAINAYNNFMSDSVGYQGAAEKELSRTAAYWFKLKDGNDLAVAWSKFKNETLSLNLGCDKVEIYDLYGNFIENLYSDNGVFHFGVSENIYYIKGHFNAFDVAKENFSIDDYNLSGPVGDTMSLCLSSNDAKTYTVKCELTSDEFEFEKEIALSGKPIKMTYKSIGGKDGEFPVRIKVYDGNKLVFLNDDYIKIENSTNAIIDAKQVSEYNDTRWQLEVEIENGANEMELSGKCTVIEPKEFADILEPISFKNIKPKLSKTFFFNIPEFIKKRTKKIVVRVESDNGYAEEYKKVMDFTSAKYAYTKPKIDGVASQNEWQTSCAATDEENNVFALGVPEHSWSGKEDLSVPKIQLMWDEDNFYFQATVIDDHSYLTPTSVDLWNLWNYDSVQFGIEDINGNNAGAVNKAFTEIGIAQKTDGKPCIYRYSSLYGKAAGELENCDVAVKSEGNTTVYEARIPWSELFTDNYVFDPNKKYGFSMLVNDNDGQGRWGWINYNDGIGETKDAVLFGKLNIYK